MRTFILRHDNSISHEYAKIAAESCDKHNMNWEYFEGFSGIKGSDALKSCGINVLKETKAPINSSKNKGQLCTASHVAMWKKIIDNKIHEAVILEHDAIMIKPFNAMLPENTIVALGYKINNPHNYDPPDEITCCYRKIEGIQGSHAYAITYKTAQRLYDGVVKRKTAGCIDSHVMQKNTFRNGVNMMITDPIVSLGWLRDSTIWNRTARDTSIKIESFEKNYHETS